MKRINVIRSGDEPRPILYKLVFVSCIVLGACGPKTESDRSTSTKFDQYYVHGEQLYIKNCSNCHQKNGTGLGLVYPPLKDSDYLQNRDEVICLIRNGKKGELIVNGKSFNQAMPPMPSLTDIEIAEITTYIYNSWGNDQGIFEVNEISKVLMRCDSIEGKVDR